MTHHAEHDSGPSISPSVDVHARTIRDEVEHMLTVLPDALERQWEASPVPKPREDTTERSHGGAPPNPTADIVLDARRLALRETVERALKALRDAAVATRGARLAMERAIADFDGFEGEGGE